MTGGRQVDILNSMKEAVKADGPQSKPRKIIGFSMTPEMAADMKVEAARRGVSLRYLPEEMWAIYKTRKPVQGRVPDAN